MSESNSTGTGTVEPPPRRRGRSALKPITAGSQRFNGVIIWSLRVLLVAFWVDMVLQVVIASLFMTGDVELLKWHDDNANLFLSTILFFALIPAILLWRPARGTTGPIWWVLGLYLLIETQKTLGYTRLVGWHIVLGVLMFGIATAFAWWSLQYKHDPQARAERIARRKGLA